MLFSFVLRIYSTNVNPSDIPNEVDIKEIKRISSIFFNKILSVKEFENYEAKKILDGESWQNSFLFEDMVEALISGSKFPEGNQGHIFHDFLENLARQVYGPIYELSLKGRDLKSNEECDIYNILEKALLPDGNNLISGLPEIRVNSQEMEKIIHDYENCFYDNDYEQGNYTNEALNLENGFPDFDDADIQPFHDNYTLYYDDDVMHPMITNANTEYNSAFIIISIGVSFIGLLVFVIYIVRQIKTYRPNRERDNNEEP